MPRQLANSTAELVIQVAEAVYINNSSTLHFIIQFCDLTSDQAINALNLAADIGFIREQDLQYKTNNILTRFLSTPDETKKAAVLRLLLEVFEPFVVFRNRLLATNSAEQAAQHTKTLLDIVSHRNEIKDTLISLGTFSGALKLLSAGRYEPATEECADELLTLAEACNDTSSAEFHIRERLSTYSDNFNRQEVILPLANALLRAIAGQCTEAVREAATAFESFLARQATILGIDLAGAAGLSTKIERFRTANRLPKKVVEAAKYLIQVRNAADHGVDIDADVGSIWTIQRSTGIEYVYVTCSIIKACMENIQHNHFVL
jgi:hypothetical protein